MIATWALVEALFAALATAWAAMPLGPWVPALILAGIAGVWARMVWELRGEPVPVFVFTAAALLSLWFAWKVVQI